jgi:hypothetical protein
VCRKSADQKRQRFQHDECWGDRGFQPGGRLNHVYVRAHEFATSSAPDLDHRLTGESQSTRRHRVPAGAENRVLREQLGGRRLRFTDGQRRRLAAKAKRLGRNGLFGITTLVTPDTLLSLVPAADRQEIRW